MKNPCEIPAFLLLLAATAAAADDFPASDLEWRGHFGRASGRAEALTLLGRVDSAAWVRLHDADAPRNVHLVRTGQCVAGLPGLFRADVDPMVEPARCLTAGAPAEGDLRRAIELAELTIRPGGDRYPADGWRRNLLNRIALRRIVGLVDDRETIGILRNCPGGEDLREPRRKAR